MFKRILTTAARNIQTRSLKTLTACMTINKSAHRLDIPGNVECGAVWERPLFLRKKCRLSFNTFTKTHEGFWKHQLKKYRLSVPPNSTSWKRELTCSSTGEQEYIRYKFKTTLEELHLLICVLKTCCPISVFYLRSFILINVSLTSQELQSLRNLALEAHKTKNDWRTFMAQRKVAVWCTAGHLHPVRSSRFSTEVCSEAWCKSFSPHTCCLFSFG